MCHKPWSSPSFCACLCLFLISKAWSLWTICLKRTELCLHHAQRKATYEVYPSSLHPLCFSLYFTVGNKLNFRINSFFERPERVTLEGRQENRQLRSCSTSAWWEGLSSGPVFGCGDSSSAWARLPVDSASLCWAWPGSNLERAGSAQLGERNTGRLDGLCHPRLLTQLNNAQCWIIPGKRFFLLWNTCYLCQVFGERQEEDYSDNLFYDSK